MLYATTCGLASVAACEVSYLIGLVNCHLVCMMPVSISAVALSERGSRV